MSAALRAGQATPAGAPAPAEAARKAGPPAVPPPAAPPASTFLPAGPGSPAALAHALAAASSSWGALLDLLRGRGPDRRLAAALFHTEAIGIATLAADGAVRRANRCFAALVPEAPGRKVAELFQPPAGTAITTWLAGRGDAPGVASLAGATGAEVAVHLARLDDGAILQIRDLARERALEQELAQHHRLQAVGQLAAGIAHDFNNLLTAIVASADEVAARDPHGPTADDMRQIRDSAERGAALVRQILAFSQQQTLQPRVLMVNEAVASVAGMLRRVLGRGIALALDLEEPGRQVRVDPVQLDQVLVNLAVNARDAMPQGGTLTLATGHAAMLRPLVTVAGTIPPGRYVTIEARDTGTGIPDAVLPHIFEPFFTTRRRAGGTGLGLATVHGILRQSGGHIAVESRAGQGTVFRLYLPRHAAPDEAATEPPRAAAAACARRLLLVEDEAPIRRLAERVLTRRGWEVLSAATAEEALAIVSPSRGLGLACVVSDVVMPGMDGPALVRALRDLWTGLPAVLMSGYAGEALREELASAEVRFLPKPFGMKELVGAVEAVCPAR